MYFSFRNVKSCLYHWTMMIKVLQRCEVMVAVTTPPNDELIKGSDTSTHLWHTSICTMWSMMKWHDPAKFVPTNRPPSNSRMQDESQKSWAGVTHGPVKSMTHEPVRGFQVDHFRIIPLLKIHFYLKNLFWLVQFIFNLSIVISLFWFIIFSLFITLLWDLGVIFSFY